LLGGSRRTSAASDAALTPESKAGSKSLHDANASQH
jgi:hypothetical protein